MRKRYGHGTYGEERSPMREANKEPTDSSVWERGTGEYMDGDGWDERRTRAYSTNTT